jgi:hypothetical protein
MSKKKVRTAVMRIMNGDNERLSNILGPEIVSKIELRRGDTVIECDPKIEEQVSTSRDAFLRLMGAGYIAFQVDETTGAGTPVKEYNPKPEQKVVLFAPFAGG